MLKYIDRLIGFDGGEIHRFFDSDPTAKAEFQRLQNDQNRKNSILFLALIIITQVFVSIGRLMGDFGFPYYNLSLLAFAIVLIWGMRYRAFRHHVTHVSLILFSVWAVTFPFFIVRLGGYNSPTYPIYMIMIIYILIFFQYEFYQYVYILTLVYLSNVAIYFLQDWVSMNDFLIRQAGMIILTAVALAGSYIHASIRRKEYYIQSILKKQKHELEDAYKKLEDQELQIVEHEKMASLGTVTAGIAHEINNPLTFITGNLQTLHEYIDDLKKLINRFENELPGSSNGHADAIKKEMDYDYLIEDLPKLLHSCEKGSERIASIVQQLRSFSRLDEAEHKPVSINESLQSLSGFLITPETGVTLTTNFGQLPVLECHPKQLNQAFEAIIENGIEAIHKSGKSGKIEITTSFHQSDGMIRVEITDNGTGIDKNIQHKIFEPFFTTKDVGQGRGLGLSMAYGIVRRHHGELRFESDPGNWTKFVIDLELKNTKI